MMYKIILGVYQEQQKLVFLNTIIADNVLRLGGRFNAAKPLLYAVCFNFLCEGKSLNH